VVRSPSLQTGRADLPHPAFRLVDLHWRGSAHSAVPKDALRRSVSTKSIALGCVQHWLALTGTRAGSSSVFLFGIFPPSCVPFAPRELLRFFATTDALTSSWAALRPRRGMNSVLPKPISLIPVLGFQTILSPTICGLSEGRGGLLHAALRLPESFALRDRLRPSLAGSPAAADRIEFTLSVCLDGRCYGLAVFVPLLSTSCCHDAVTVRYRTLLQRTEADFHHSNRAPFQAHERGLQAASTCECLGLNVCRSASE